jgi:Na+-driven multidrug efflux pump
LAAGIRSQGRAGTSLAIGASMLVVNTALCAGFVFGLGWGTAGSAWAVLGANLVGLLLYWAYYRFGDGALRVDWRLLRPCGGDQFEIVRTGVGAWLANTMPALLILVVNSLMARHAGDTGLALVGIVHVVGLMAIMPVLGVMQAAGPLFSYNHGAGRPERVRRAFRQSLAAASLVLCAFWVPIEVFPAQTAGLFAAGNAALEKLAGATFGVFFLAYPLIGITYAVSQYFQSIGRGGASAINALSRQVVFLVPAMLIMERLGGFTGFVWSTPVADGLGVLLALAFWWREHLRSKSTPARVTADG